MELFRGRFRNALLLTLVLLGFVFLGKVMGVPSWTSDMFVQPAIRPYMMPRGRTKPLPLPPKSIPVGAEDVGVTRNELASIKTNPRPLTAASLARGERLFATYCFVCHGSAGRGDGPVIKKGFYPVDLTSPVVKSRTDGYIFAYIRMGGLVMMPRYDEFISPDEAWDIVHYVRKLQGLVAEGGGRN